MYYIICAHKDESDSCLTPFRAHGVQRAGVVLTVLAPQREVLRADRESLQAKLNPKNKTINPKHES
jgi:hypothetical protein